MAADFDSFPIYDAVLKSDSNKLSDVWVSFLATFGQTLVGYLTQYGIFVPKVTTAERDSLQNVDDGQVIYNTTLSKFQGREAGAWVNFV